MHSYIAFADKVSSWFGKTFAWGIIIMTFGTDYEVFMRYIMRNPTSWAFDLSYMMYGTLFMVAGAYTLSRDGHVRGDFVFRLWPPRVQATIELVLYFIFFFPAVTALIFAGWKYASRSWRFHEVSVMSPANIPIFQFKTVIVAAGILLFIQGIAQVFRCIHCIRTGVLLFIQGIAQVFRCIRTGIWVRAVDDIEETEIKLMKGEDVREIIHHGSEAADVVEPMRRRDGGRSEQ